MKFPYSIVHFLSLLLGGAALICNVHKSDGTGGQCKAERLGGACSRIEETWSDGTIKIIENCLKTDLKAQFCEIQVSCNTDYCNSNTPHLDLSSTPEQLTCNCRARNKRSFKTFKSLISTTNEKCSSNTCQTFEALNKDEHPICVTTIEVTDTGDQTVVEQGCSMATGVFLAKTHGCVCFTDFCNRDTSISTTTTTTTSGSTNAIAKTFGISLWMGLLALIINQI